MSLGAPRTGRDGPKQRPAVRHSVGWLDAALTAGLSLAALALTLVAADRAIGRFGLGPTSKPFSEFGLTLAPNEYGTRLKPGYRGRYTNAEFSISIEINSLGLRGPEVGPRAQTGAHRVLAVGDSFTFGQGVEHGEAWPAQVERAIAGIEVINAGWADAGPVGYLNYLRASGWRLDPDLVLVGVFVGNDVVDDLASEMSFASEVERLAFQAAYLENLRLRIGLTGAVRSAIDTLIPNLYEVAALAIVKLQYLLGGHRAHFDYILSEREPPELGRGWELSLGALRQIREEARSRGIPIGIIIIPFLDQVAPTTYPPGHDKDRPQKRIMQFCESEAIACLDLLPTLRASRDRAALYHIKDGHWTREGNAIAAAAVAYWIQKHSLLQSPPR